MVALSGNGCGRIGRRRPTARCRSGCTKSSQPPPVGAGVDVHEVNEMAVGGAGRHDARRLAGVGRKDVHDALFGVGQRCAVQIVPMIERAERQQGEAGRIGRGRVKAAAVEHERIADQPRWLNRGDDVVLQPIDLIVANGVRDPGPSRPTPTRRKQQQRCRQTRTIQSTFQRGPVGANHVGIKPGRGFRHAPLRLKVHVHDAEPLRVAALPLEIVEQRPDEVTAQVDAGLDRLPCRSQVVMQIFYPLGDHRRRRFGVR